jgi:hypothetical protein
VALKCCCPLALFFLFFIKHTSIPAVEYRNNKTKERKVKMRREEGRSERVERGGNDG